MSALGQKKTCAVQNGMSALPPKADMCGATRDVRFVPKADMAGKYCRPQSGVIMGVSGLFQSLMKFLISLAMLKAGQQLDVVARAPGSQDFNAT